MEWVFEIVLTRHALLPDCLMNESSDSTCSSFKFPLTCHTLESVSKWPRLNFQQIFCIHIHSAHVHVRIHVNVWRNVVSGQSSKGLSLSI